ncbi:hypothetical protein O4215_10835 [Rhodococcus maanshanensis]|nr:hypothetical protein [Rhodococcus maanshanensis]MCZ4556072.1 hypothetical protein [Rhodococcus maanshanensis]
MFGGIGIDQTSRSGEEGGRMATAAVFIDTLEVLVTLALLASLMF